MATCGEKVRIKTIRSERRKDDAPTELIGKQLALFDFDASAGALDFALEGFGIFFRDTFLEG